MLLDVSGCRRAHPLEPQEAALSARHPPPAGGWGESPAAVALPLLQIPLTIEIRETSDEGSPIVWSHPGRAAAQAYVAVAERIWRKLQELDQGPAAGPVIEVE